LHPAAAVLFTLAAQAPSDSGAALFHAWCKACHGADGRGVAAASTRLEVPPADLATRARCGLARRRAAETVGPEPHRPRLISFLLWDFGDASLLRGW